MRRINVVGTSCSGKTHRRRRRTMAARLDARPEVQAIRLRSPAEAERWVRGLAFEAPVA